MILSEGNFRRNGTVIARHNLRNPDLQNFHIVRGEGVVDLVAHEHEGTRLPLQRGQRGGNGMLLLLRRKTEVGGVHRKLPSLGRHDGAADDPQTEAVYDSAADPLISLSYVTEVLTPAYDAKINALTDSVSALQKSVTAAQSENTALRSELAAAKKPISSLETRLSSVKSEMLPIMIAAVLGANEGAESVCFIPMRIYSDGRQLCRCL